MRTFGFLSRMFSDFIENGVNGIQINENRKKLECSLFDGLLDLIHSKKLNQLSGQAFANC